jgi:hypothetical protein
MPRWQPRDRSSAPDSKFCDPWNMECSFTFPYFISLSRNTPSLCYPLTMVSTYRVNLPSGGSQTTPTSVPICTNCTAQECVIVVPSSESDTTTISVVPSSESGTTTTSVAIYANVFKSFAFGLALVGIIAFGFRFILDDSDEGWRRGKADNTVSESSSDVPATTAPAAVQNADFDSPGFESWAVLVFVGPLMLFGFLMLSVVSECARWEQLYSEAKIVPETDNIILWEAPLNIDSPAVQNAPPQVLHHDQPAGEQGGLFLSPPAPLFCVCRD